MLVAPGLSLQVQPPDAVPVLDQAGPCVRHLILHEPTTSGLYDNREVQQWKTHGDCLNSADDHETSMEGD